MSKKSIISLTIIFFTFKVFAGYLDDTAKYHCFTDEERKNIPKALSSMQDQFSEDEIKLLFDNSSYQRRENIDHKSAIYGSNTQGRAKQKIFISQDVCDVSVKTIEVNATPGQFVTFDHADINPQCKDKDGKDDNCKAWFDATIDELVKQQQLDPENFLPFQVKFSGHTDNVEDSVLNTMILNQCYGRQTDKILTQLKLCKPPVVSKRCVKILTKNGSNPICKKDLDQFKEIYLKRLALKRASVMSELFKEKLKTSSGASLTEGKALIKRIQQSQRNLELPIERGKLLSLAYDYLQSKGGIESSSSKFKEKIMSCYEKVKDINFYPYVTSNLIRDFSAEFRDCNIYKNLNKRCKVKLDNINSCLNSSKLSQSCKEKLRSHIMHDTLLMGSKDDKTYQWKCPLPGVSIYNLIKQGHLLKLFTNLNQQHDIRKELRKRISISSVTVDPVANDKAFDNRKTDVSFKRDSKTISKQLKGKEKEFMDSQEARKLVPEISCRKLQLSKSQNTPEIKEFVRRSNSIIDRYKKIPSNLTQCDPSFNICHTHQLLNKLKYGEKSYESKKRKIMEKACAKIRDGGPTIKKRFAYAAIKDLIDESNFNTSIFECESDIFQTSYNLYTDEIYFDLKVKGMGEVSCNIDQIKNTTDFNTLSKFQLTSPRTWQESVMKLKDQFNCKCGKEKTPCKLEEALDFIAIFYSKNRAGNLFASQVQSIITPRFEQEDLYQERKPTSIEGLSSEIKAVTDSVLSCTEKSDKRREIAIESIHFQEQGKTPLSERELAVGTLDSSALAN